MIKNENTLMNFVKDLYEIEDLQYADFIKALVLVKFYPNDLLTRNHKLVYFMRIDKKNIEKIFHNINRIYYEISELLIKYDIITISDEPILSLIIKTAYHEMSNNKTGHPIPYKIYYSMIYAYIYKEYNSSYYFTCNDPHRTFLKNHPELPFYIKGKKIIFDQNKFKSCNIINLVNDILNLNLDYGVVMKSLILIIKFPKYLIEQDNEFLSYLKDEPIYVLIHDIQKINKEMESFLKKYNIIKLNKNHVIEEIINAAHKTILSGEFRRVPYKIFYVMLIAYINKAYREVEFFKPHTRSMMNDIISKYNLPFEIIGKDSIIYTGGR